MGAIDVLDPQIRGLENLIKGIVSPALRDAVGGQLGLLVRRRELIKNSVGALDGVLRNLEALDIDGYPTFEPAALSPELKKELDDFVATATAGAEIFKTLTKP